MAAADVNPVSWSHVIVAFTTVVALLAGFGFVMKYVSTRGFRLPGVVAPSDRRLQLLETLPLDVRRRLVIVRCDGREHLLLLGANQDIVVDNDLEKNRLNAMTEKGNA